MSDKNKKPRDWQRVALIIACVVLAVILAVTLIAAVALGLVGGIWGKTNHINGQPTMSPSDASNVIMGDAVTVDPNNTNPVVRPEDVVIPDAPVAPLGQGDHILNIMLVGQDRRPGEGMSRSDTMILVTFNKSQKTITLTSFMRDEYVNIPGYGKTKLCHAYQYGGMDLLGQTIYNHYGIEIQGMVEVDFSSFEEIIDLLGGVDIKLTKKEADQMNVNGGWPMSAGVQHLNGEQALYYARMRSIDTDYRRSERQRNVLIAIIEEYKNQSLPKMLSLLDEILPMVYTNIDEKEMTQYVTSMFPMVAGAQVNNHRIPLDGTFTEGYIRVYENMELWCQYNIDFAANQKLLEEIFSE